MAAELIAGLGIFKTMFDIAKGLQGIHDTAARDRAVIELQKEILSAQAAQSALVDQVGNLEKEVARLKAWDADKQRYQLTEISTGVLAYTLKEGMEAGEPFHMLCANCYQHNEKSLLQATQELRKARRVHNCPHCKAEFEMGNVDRPPPPVNRGPAGGSWGAARRG